MNVQELVDELQSRIDSGDITPSTVVVRPFCMCDQDVGYVEARHLDQVIRLWESTPNGG